MDTDTVTIIFTADMHSRLTPQAADYLARLKRRHDALLLDGGDAISAGNVFIRPGGEPVLDLMNQAGYDAMTIGNREYFFRKGGLIGKTLRARFPLLAANIELAESDDRIKPWIIIEKGNCRVGVVGFARQMVPPGAWWEKTVSARFRDWRVAADEAVSRLTGRVDLLVALTHLGGENNRQLALQRPEIDLILAGHDHPPQARDRPYSGRPRPSAAA